MTDVENPYYNVPSSGPGATPEYTKEFREYIISTLAQVNPDGTKVFVDLGCGIWDYQRCIPWVDLGVHYVGLDIKPNVISHNTDLFAKGSDPTDPKKGSIRFMIADVFAKSYRPFPGDFYLIKDVLQHVSNLDLIRLLEKLRRTDAKVMVANCSNQASNWQDVAKPGDWRPLNNELFPLKLFEYNWVFMFGSKQVYVNSHFPKPGTPKWPDYVDKPPLTDRVLMAILVKDKAHTLPLYLDCLDNQTYPKHLISVYIRTNNNTDNSAEILRRWKALHEKEYERIVLEDQDVEQQVQRFKQHEWNSERFHVLGKIRQRSVDLAIELGCDWYFVIDADNFILPNTLRTLMETGLPVIAPMLHMDWPAQHLYSNYHQAVDANGYFANSPYYTPVWAGEVKGLIQQPVVHTTYLVRKDVLPVVSYDDATSRYEYVIFSDVLRKAKIPQYLDNRHAYGYLTMASTAEELEEDVIKAKLRYSEKTDDWV